MTRANELLIQALAAALRGERVDWQEELSPQVWQAFFAQAREQKVLPLVFNSIYTCPAYLALPEQGRGQLKQEVTRAVIGQTMRTAAVGQLCQAMREQGLTPVVMKGIACRSLYPNPDLRLSSDEDVLVPREQFAKSVEVLLSLGYQPQGEYRVEKDFEIGFRTPQSYIELHKSPFDPNSDALSVCNRDFEDSYRRGLKLTADGFTMTVMGPRDHMLYLILHAFKHLIHSGFGLRQICDIVRWAEVYGKDIDWNWIRERCDQVRCWPFAAATFQIGKQYFGFDPGASGLPADLLEGEWPWEELLEDLLQGGIYGGSDRSRMHSSTITLRAVEAQRKGKRSSLLTTLFPGHRQMAGAYPYLERWPVLLPVAWGQRIFRYGREVSKNQPDNRPAESIRVGNERLELLKKLDIID